MSQLLTAEEVAAIFRVRRETVTDWHRAGKLRGTRYGRRILFEPVDVEAFKVKQAAS